MATASLTQAQNFQHMAGLIFIIGCLQGGAGGLFMTAVVDAVGVNLAKYAFGLENCLDVFVAGFATQAYGGIGDRFFKSEIVDKGEVVGEVVNLDYVFYTTGCCILIAGVVALFGARIEKMTEVVDKEDVKAFDAFLSSSSNSNSPSDEKLRV